MRSPAQAARCGTPKRAPAARFAGSRRETQIFWADGNRLVFPWERDGWLHLYSVSADGGRAQLLTPGDFEVEHVSLSRNRREVLFSSNQDDIDRRHVWRVAVSGRQAYRDSGSELGEGIEWEPADVADGAVAFLRSSATEISRAAVKIGSAPVRDLAPDSIPADFPKDLVKPQQVIFPASDGLPIHGQLFLPPAGGARETRGRDLLSWRLAAADAAGLSLPALLFERLCDESVSGQLADSSC